MQKFFNQIKSLPLYGQILVAALPSLILVGLFVYFILLPKNKEISELKTKSAQLDTDIIKAEAKVKRLDALIAENEILKKKLSRLKEQLPEEKEVSVLLREVSELGRGSGLEILLWKPQPKKTNPEGLYVEIPVKVEVMAKYHNFGDFLSHVSRLPRLVNISDIESTSSQKPEDAESGIVNIKFTARTFASVAQNELPQKK